MNSLSWKHKDIGLGNIIDSLIKSIEVKNNNLVTIADKYGPGTKSHQYFLDSKKEEKHLFEIESLLYNFYLLIISDEMAFNKFIGLLGKKYSLIAYLFFVKNDREYLPIAPDHFDEIFKLLNLAFRTTRKCSWTNYIDYIAIIKEVKLFLETYIEDEVHLVDAHSFLWIIGNQMRKKSLQTTNSNIEFPRPIIIPYELKPINKEKKLHINKKNKEQVADTERFLESQKRNRVIGATAEDIVVQEEKRMLNENGRRDLSEKVKNVSANTELGYDIESYELDGRKNTLK